MTMSALRMVGLCAAVVAWVAVAAASAACSDCPSANPQTGQALPAGNSIDSNGPKEIARRAVQAQIDGDEAGYLELVRPDEREWADTDDLRGCDLEGAEVLVEQESISELSVTVMFGQPCGTSGLGDPYKYCTIDLVKLSDRLYVEGTSQCMTW